MKKWKRVVDNKMRWHGDIDEKKKIIRVNKSKKKNERKGEIIDTILHEEDHRIHPKAYEKTIRKIVKRQLNRIGSKGKKKLYSKYQKRSD
jgi:acetyl-CoA carboxylase alpha subunit